MSLLAGGHLIVLTEDGDLALVRATPERHDEVARFPVLEGRTWNHPAMADGFLLIRNSTEMAPPLASLLSQLPYTLSIQFQNHSTLLLALALVLALVLGAMLEDNLRRAMTISRGDPTVFFTRPLSLALLAIALLLLMAMLVPSIAKRRE